MSASAGGRSTFTFGRLFFPVPRISLQVRLMWPQSKGKRVFIFKLHVSGQPPDGEIEQADQEPEDGSEQVDVLELLLHDSHQQAFDL